MDGCQKPSGTESSIPNHSGERELHISTQLYNTGRSLIPLITMIYSESRKSNGSPYTLEDSPSYLSIQKRARIILNCIYQKKTIYHFYWFSQDPGKGLKVQADKNLKELLGNDKFCRVLHIPDSHPGDSADYFCALPHSVLQAPAVCTTTLQLDLITQV
ncbi:hypothetical protein HPG69_002142 [Diceros bicornis minor]|uniref:Ig-like domain-containing protein n=1 Tax=Diceros bicornis minor TaxID=77932 RepID=A0A7J7FC95_DICBM|nr:hypothetical protein HPG69_002142 [Diceros bicornis minor]